MLRDAVISAILLALLMFNSGCPPSKPLPVQSPAAAPDDAMSFHNGCAQILANYVDDKGMVNYKALKRQRKELRALQDKFAELDSDRYDSWSKEDKAAFWLNVYNIQLLKIIVDNYPIEASRVFMVFWPPTSIRHINKRIGGIDNQKFIVMDEEFTLKEIEQRFFRGRFDDPRLFLALSKASVAGPPLRNEPYYGSRLYAQLDEQAGKFLSSPQAFRIDREKKVVYLNAIFRPKWYGNEFISKYGIDKKYKDHDSCARAVLNFAANYISQQDAAFLEVESYSVKYINYDWRLNE